MRCSACNKTIQKDLEECNHCGAPISWARFEQVTLVQEQKERNKESIKCKVCGAENHIPANRIDRSWCIRCGNTMLWTTNPSKYIPNHIPFLARLFFFAFLCLCVYASFRVLVHGIAYFGGRRVSFEIKGYYYFEWPERVLPLLAFVSFVIAFGSFIIDHYDKRHNEIIYRKITNYLSWAGLFLYGICIYWGSKAA